MPTTYYFVALPRSVAASRAIPRYFTEPCTHGHYVSRSTRTSLCLECGREASRKARHVPQNAENARSWRAKNYAEHGDTLRERRRAAYHADIERGRESGRRSSRTWRAKNPEISRQRVLAYQAANPGTVRAVKRRRRRAVVERTPPWFGEFDQFVEAEAYALCALRTRLTAIVWHVDHMVPLLARSASGLHCAANLQVIPERLNRQKGNKLWYTTLGDWIRAS